MTSYDGCCDEVSLDEVGEKNREFNQPHSTHEGSHKIKCLFALAAACIFFPLNSWSQTVPTVSNKEADSKKEAEDAKFKVYFGARDGQLALIGEIKRLHTYHENLKSRLRNALTDYSRIIEKGLDAVEPTRNSITAEIGRTNTFLTEYEKAKDSKLIEEFDSKYPINYKQLLRGEKGGITIINKPFNVLFLLSARQSTLDLSRNLLNDENKAIYTEYDNLFTKMETDFENFERPGAMEQLNGLPTQFSYLVHKESSQAMSAEDVSTAVNRYLEVLKKSGADLTTFGSNPEMIRANIWANAKTYLADMDRIGDEITTLLKNADYKLDTIEGSIAGSARALYGNKVGSESFNYLLYVFAAVFLLIMLLPRLYSSDVANNILKAEFLLQFSTVFVLVAAIIILGIGDLIDKQQLPVLLAGISGYVLGQLGQVKAGNDTNCGGSTRSAGASEMRHPSEGTTR